MPGPAHGRALVAVLAILALGQAAVPGMALAQCDPAPPPAPANTTSYANQTFGNTPPLLPFPGVLSIGNGGCGGVNAGDDLNGTNGSPGQPGGAVTSTNTGLTIVGATTNPFGAPTTASTLGSFGGTGGVGGAAGNAYIKFTTGGDGGAGGNAGQVNIVFNAIFQSDPATGLASDLLVVYASGGQGGAGGGTANNGGYAKLGGNGSIGGAGGSVSLTASGTFVGQLRGITGAASGGNAGAGGPADSQGDLLSTATAGDGGGGGAGGTVAVEFAAGTISTTQFGIVALAIGGGGGNGGQATNALGLKGGEAGAGGSGGTAGVTLSGGAVTVNQPATITGAGAGILVRANGAPGGPGGFAGPTLGSGGGTGGAGGQGGSASASILGSVTYNGAGVTGLADGQAVLVQANGGLGGAGGGASGFEGQSGSGGLAGAGGSASLVLGSSTSRGIITSAGNFAHGALVQSVGGGGGDGGSASFFAGGGGGGGAAGGDGGIVTVIAPNASVLTASKSGAALIAQSIGGGGGSGGDITAVGAGGVLVIGGTGGLGGDGSSVRINLSPGVFASVSPLGGAGILAQSIGGSGGTGGSAAASGVGLISLAIGGNAGSGGIGGLVIIDSSALVTTYGDHAAGIQAQSIGGGGGKGGSAVSFAAGLVPVAAVSVGGSGGGGGAAGQVGVTNTAQVTTYGADAHGLLVQSIGGGGGSGGAAAARAVDISPSRQIPAISVSIATGGVGGVGNTGNTLTLNNSGLITTSGDGSIGVMAQSIGGGGGTGGDSTAASFTGGSTGGGLSVAIDISVGGSGGTGGTGGTVTLSNSGVILTYGQDAFGVFAQSVGGGGGTGGGGDATSTADEAKFSFSTSIGLGGRGGLGGHGAAVGLTNSGAIATSGDGAAGVFAQSVGGGGGTGGGGTASAAGGNLAISVGVGGSGGAGGNGDTVTVANSGSVLTRGTDSIAIFAQSVGGGGGSGGKAGATAGGVSPFSNAAALNDLLLNGLNFGIPHTTLIDGIVQIGEIGENLQASIAELRGMLAQPQAGSAKSGTSVQINVAVSAGGSGGAAGGGGAVNVTSTGLVETYGAQADGIYAQSVGGGGGSAGGATSTSSASDDTPAQTAIGVGGTGGGGGAGGTVTVVNGTGGTVLTQGVAAFGLFAQSVGGGGGEASAAGTVSGSFKSLSVSVGGNGGSGGDGGAVSVTTSDNTGSAVTTTGKHGIAVIAQSVGGGGGLVRTMTTDQTFDPSKIVINPQGRIGDLHGLNLDFGGQNGIGGNGGTVLLTVNGPITTSGLGAHGVLGQSIGGGGGLVVGGRVLQNASASGGASGHGGAVTVRLQAGTVIATAGHGAYGVMAQSVGGGGGIAGDLSGSAQAGALPAVSIYDSGRLTPVVRPGSGDGGKVSVTATGTQVHTTGRYAPAIFAQSVGGGGGLVAYIVPLDGDPSILFRGSVGGSGAGGAVSVSAVNSSILADGVGSAGILAQSAGPSRASIQVAIDAASRVRGGAPDPASTDPSGDRDAAAIRLLGGTANLISNAGQIIGMNGGVAILADTPQGNTMVTNTGTIAGDIVMNNGNGNIVDNRAGGMIIGRLHLSDADGSAVVGNAGTIRTQSVRLGGGTLTNAGLLDVSGTGAASPTVQGNYRSVAGGILRVGADFAGGTADSLTVTGNVVLEPGSVLQVTPLNWRKGSVTVLIAGGTLGQNAAVVESSGPAYLFGLTTEHTGNTITVRTISRIGLLAGNLNAGQRGIAGVLERLWDSDSGLPGTEALASINSARSYSESLNSIAGKAVAGIVAAKQAASEQFAGSLFSCDLPGDGPITLKQESCRWIRVTGAQAALASSGSDPGFRQTTTTYQAGGQKEVAPGWFVGGSLGYERNWLTGEGGRSKVAGEVAAGGLMLKHQTGPWLLAGVLEGGYGWYNSRRQVVVGTTGGHANGSPNVAHIGLHLRAEHTTFLGNWYVKPNLSLAAIYRHMSGYSETGSTPFNLRVKPSSDIMGSAAPMVEVGRGGRIRGIGSVRGFAGIGAAFYVNNAWQTEAGLEIAPDGAQSFIAKSPLPNTVGRVAAGLNLITAGGVEAKLTYTASLAPGFTAQSFIGRLAYPF